MSIEAAPRLVVLPLGGCGEVGLNATLLIHGEHVLLIDCGALIGVWDAPGIERAVPGFEPLFTQGRRLLGIVLTHGHEDHIGALPALLAEVDAPVFGSATTIAFARSRLERSPAERSAQDKLTVVPFGRRIEIGPFQVELIRVTHSIPDASAIYVETPFGRILHSGDFKLDEHHLEGHVTDIERLRALGDRGIDLLLSDSTNAEAPGRGKSELDVARGIDAIVAATPGRVVVSLFSSHLHRISAAVEAARRHGRKILLAGRSLERTWEIGIERGLLPSDPTLLLTPEGAAQKPRREVLVLATGTQGELTGGLARIAAGNDAAFRPLPGDRVVLSSRTIPGNEKPVRRIVNELVKRGIDVIHDRMAPVHCSGHAYSEEQADMLRLVRPKHFLPIHGERSMLEAHAKIAVAAGVERSRIQVIEDGETVVLDRDGVVRGPDEEISKRMVDASGRILSFGDVRERRRMSKSGLVFVSLAIERSSGVAMGAAINGRGFMLPSATREELKKIARDAVAGRESVEAMERTVKVVIREAVRSRLGSAPEVEVQLVVVG